MYSIPLTESRIHLIDKQAHLKDRTRPTPLKCKNEYLVLALGEETAVKELVGCIVWEFRRLKNPRCRDMSARGYALHSV